jgi:hypothetical protein
MIIFASFAEAHTQQIRTLRAYPPTPTHTHPHAHMTGTPTHTHAHHHLPTHMHPSHPYPHLPTHTTTHPPTPPIWGTTGRTHPQVLVSPCTGRYWHTPPIPTPPMAYPPPSVESVDIGRDATVTFDVHFVPWNPRTLGVSPQGNTSGGYRREADHDRHTCKPRR